MTAVPRGSLPKRSNPYEPAAVGSAFICAGIAGEVAAQMIASAAGHHVPAAPVWHGLYSPLDGYRWLATLNLRCLSGLHPIGRLALSCATPRAFIQATDAHSLPWLGAGLISYAGFWLAGGRKQRTQRVKGRAFAPVHHVEGRPASLVIELGTATGKLAALGHEMGIAREQRVKLVGDDVSQDFFIVGAKGSGKTLLINSLLLQAMRQNCGAVIFNVKGDYDATVLKLARKAGRKVRVIGIGAERFDTMGGVNPEQGAAYVSALLLLSGNRSAEATFWNAGAANLARGVLGLLYQFPFHYSLPNLYRYLFVDGYRESIDRLVKNLSDRLCEAAQAASKDHDQPRLDACLVDIKYIDGCVQEIENFSGRIVEEADADGKVTRKRVGGMTHEIQSGIRGQLSQVLAKMVIPEVEQSFGTPLLDDEKGADLTDVLSEGAIFVINAPPQIGLAAAAIQTFIKLRVFDMMEQRRLEPNWNQERRVGLFIDEYQDVATCSSEGQSDDKFLAKSRDTGTFCVFSTQSIFGLMAKVGRDATEAITANLCQRVVYRSMNKTTIEEALYLLGQTSVQRESANESRNSGSLRRSKGTSVQPTIEALADPSLIRNLRKGQALCLLSVDGESADDVIQMRREYVGTVRA